MSEDDVLRKAIESIVSSGVLDGRDLVGSEREDVASFVSQDLPRIIVRDESIIVLEKDDLVDNEDNSWGEKNVLREVYGKGDLTDEALILTELFNDVDSPRENLENLVKGLNEKDKDVADEMREGDGGSYEAKRSSQELYDNKKEKYDSSNDYENVGIEGVDFGSNEDRDRRLGERSNLEIAGFVDVEMEEKRKKKREGSFI